MSATSVLAAPVLTNGHEETAVLNSPDEHVEVAGLSGVQVVYHYPRTSEGRNHAITKRYHSQKTKLRVACIGAGLSWNMSCVQNGAPDATVLVLDPIRQER